MVRPRCWHLIFACSAAAGRHDQRLWAPEAVGHPALSSTPSSYWKMSRLTVRPGPALELILSDGECIRVSTPDPDTAALLITGPGNAAAGQAGTGDTGTGARDKGTGEQHA